MSGNHTEFNNVLTRAYMTGMMKLFIWLFVRQWRFYKFTAAWLIILALLLDTGLTNSGVPGALGAMLVVLAIIFCVFWTSRNIIRWRQKQQRPPTQEQLLEEQTDGVFFGMTRRWQPC